MSQIIQFKRKREGKTDYRRRLKLLISNKPRIIIRKSIKNIMIQLAEYNSKGDKIIVTSHSNELRKKGWKLNTGNIPSAYLTGFLFGNKLKKKKIIENMILDIGFNSSIKGNRIYSALKGIIDAGIEIKCDEKIFPTQERINGEHIHNYIESFKKEKKKEENKQFSNYIKANTTDITKEVKELKQKIIEK